MDVSVIIPVYNAEKYLQDCLGSVIDQTDVECEIICINDASTDGSLDILTSICSADKRIRLINLPHNHGQAYARNRGIEAANGKYLYFLDSDDELSDSYALSRLLAYAESDSVDCVCFDSRVEYENEGLKPLLAYRERLNEDFAPGVYDGGAYFGLFFGNPGFSVAVWRQFWRKSFLDNNEIRFCEDTSPHEDLLFTFQAYFLSRKISYVPEIMHKYRFRENSSSSGIIGKKRIRSYQKIYIESLRFLDKHTDNQRALSYESIMRYLRSCLTPIYINYARVITEGDELIKSDDEDDQLDRLFRDWTIMQKFPLLERTFNRQDIEHIKRKKYIIVYGAGSYSIQLQQMMLDFGITGYEVCVSKGNGDHIEIRELQDRAEDAVVILGATEQYRVEMRNKAEELGFDDIFELTF